MKKNKEKEFLVTMDVFFMESHSVFAKNKKEAFKKAKERVNHGMGEEITLFEIEEVIIPPPDPKSIIRL